MKIFTRLAFAILLPVALIAAACGSSDDAATGAEAGDSTTSSETSESTDETADGSTDESIDETGDGPADESTGDDGSLDGEPMSWFVEGALTSEATTVPCTLENGSESTCYQVEVASLSSTVDTDGPYCPETLDETGGIWVWDGDEPGLYALDADFWAMMEAQSYEFVDADGNVSITDPAAAGASSGTTANSCLEATPDGSFHIQVLLPTTPELLDEPTNLSTISQVGLALDGVTIFGDAPSVADRGGLPALDACGGHIDPSGYYHWHFGAESIQTNLDDAGADVTCAVEQNTEVLIGFAYDGHPIYGPEENGDVPFDLDECSGHTAATDEFGETYHYHLTYDSPNLPTCRVGASAVGTLTSPDNPDASLPSGEGPGAGGGGAAPPAGPPPGDDT